MNGTNSPARVPQICTKVDWLWTASAVKTYFGGHSTLVSVNQSFFPLTFNCLHWLMCFLPKAFKYGRVRGTKTKWLENKPRCCTVPSSSLQASLQGRACTLPRESQHAWLLCAFGICVGVSRGKGGICQSPCRQLAHESFQPKGAIQKNTSCALESGCFHGWLVPGWLVFAVGAQKVNLCFWADQFHSQFLIYNPWSYDTSLYLASSPTSFLPRFTRDLSVSGENYKKTLQSQKTIEKDKTWKI